MEKILLIEIGATKIADAERRLVLATLDHFEGNRVSTAQALGVSLKTVYNKLEKYASAA